MSRCVRIALKIKKNESLKVGNRSETLLYCRYIGVPCRRG